MERVSAHALTLAELCEARIHVVNVVDETTYMTLPDDVRDQLQQTFEEDGHSATKIIAEEQSIGDLTCAEKSVGEILPSPLSRTPSKTRSILS
nr:hypothetical protein [Haladaptatus sp. DYSN1]